jgi:hypothetical protein
MRGLVSWRSGICECTQDECTKNILIQAKNSLLAGN